MLPTSKRLQLTSSRYFVHCPFLSLSSHLKKNPNKQGVLGGASKLHLFSLDGSLEASESRRDPNPGLLACPRAAAVGTPTNRVQRSFPQLGARPIQAVGVEEAREDPRCLRPCTASGTRRLLPLLRDPLVPGWTRGLCWAGLSEKWVDVARKGPGRAETLENPEVKVAPGHPARLSTPGRQHSWVARGIRTYHS